MTGPGLKRKGAAQTRGYVAPQNVEVLGDNSTEGSRLHVRRRIMTSLTPPRSPMTRSQARCPRGSLVR